MGVGVLGVREQSFCENSGGDRRVLHSKQMFYVLLKTAGEVGGQKKLRRLEEYGDDGHVSEKKQQGPD